MFELIGPPRRNKDNPTPCPPVLSIALEYMGMVLECPCLALESQLVQKSNKYAHHEMWSFTDPDFTAYEDTHRRRPGWWIMRKGPRGLKRSNWRTHRMYFITGCGVQKFTKNMWLCPMNCVGLVNQNIIFYVGGQIDLPSGHRSPPVAAGRRPPAAGLGPMGKWAPWAPWGPRGPKLNFLRRRSNWFAVRPPAVRPPWGGANGPHGAQLYLFLAGSPDSPISILTFELRPVFLKSDTAMCSRQPLISANRLHGRGASAA